jgi:hypothetical protein
MKFLPLLALFGMLSWANAESALRWESKTVEAQANPGDKTARAEFVFTNVSKQPVTISSVKPGCGCTTATLEKKTYEPGEKGHITAIFTPGSHQGTQVKGIRVAVRGEAEPTTLTMVTHIGAAPKMDPPLVFWRTGEAPHPKTIHVKLPPEAGLRLVKVTSNNPKIAAKLATLKEGSDYQLSVTPEATKERTTAILTIQGQTRSNEPKEFQAYAQIK